MADINQRVKVFELSLVMDSTKLYIDYKTPQDKTIATKVMRQFDIDADKFNKVQTFYKVMDKALLTLMKE